MSTTSKNKILLLAVVFLLLTNIAMLILFLNMGHGKRGPHGGRDGMMKEFLKTEIGFNPMQLQLYDSLSKEYMKKVKISFTEMRNSKTQMFKDLGTAAFSDSAIILATDKSASIQKQMEVKMLTHFKEIRNLCTPDQQLKFDSLFYKVWNRKGENRNKPK